MNIFKAATSFLPASQIELGLQEVARQLQRHAPLEELKALKADAKRGTPGVPDEVAGRLAGPVAEFNFVHPFRDGNGRTTRAYLDQIAQRAGLRFGPAKLDPEAWMKASIVSADDPGNTKLLRAQMATALVPAERGRAPQASAHGAAPRTRDREAEEDRGR